MARREATPVGMEGYQVVELSGEHPHLPHAELWGALQGLNHRVARSLSSPRVIAFHPPTDPAALANRLALARFVGEVLVTGSQAEVTRQAEGIDLGGRRFRVRVADPEGEWDSMDLEATLGQALANTGRVDLEAPEREIRLLRLDPACLCVVRSFVDRAAFEARGPEKRPFSRPIGLHPRLARALVNLSGVPAGGTLLDPFCGGGGVVVEAALVGARTVGSDRDARMVEGAAENLAHFGVEADLRVCDVGEIPQVFGKVDAIATDPPYGRASGTQGEALGPLLRRAFAACQRVLRRGGRLAIGLSQRKHIALGAEPLQLLEWHALPVHRSLVRYFAVYEKP